MGIPGGMSQMMSGNFSNTHIPPLSQSQPAYVTPNERTSLEGSNMYNSYNFPSMNNPSSAASSQNALGNSGFLGPVNPNIKEPNYNHPPRHVSSLPVRRRRSDSTHNYGDELQGPGFSETKQFHTLWNTDQSSR